jgi:hypothetical protein
VRGISAPRLGVKHFSSPQKAEERKCAMENRRELSMHQSDELIHSLEKAGFDPGFAQPIIDSKDNDLARKLVSYLRELLTPSISEAREIMGQDNFFGPDEWQKFFNNQFVKVPKIPWTKSELKNLPFKHFLFLGDAAFNPISWKAIGSTFDSRLKHNFMKIPCELRWYLMPVGIFPKSINKYIGVQVRFIKPNYEVPKVTERFTANVLYFMLNNKYLDNSIWATTIDAYGANEYVLIRSVRNVLCLGTEFANITKECTMGVAASMKLPSH